MSAGLHYQKFWVEICFMLIRVIVRIQYHAVLEQTSHLWVTSSQSSPKPLVIAEVLSSQNILPSSDPCTAKVFSYSGVTFLPPPFHHHQHPYLFPPPPTYLVFHYCRVCSVGD